MKDSIGLGSGCLWEWSLGDIENWNVVGDYRQEDEEGTFGIVGGVLWHPSSDIPREAQVRPGMCVGGVSFTRPKRPSGSEATSPVWTVNSLEPLDISPSVLCSCGFHGFIRQGQWIPA